MNASRFTRKNRNAALRTSSSDLPPPSPRTIKKSLAERLITNGILVMAAAMCISLFTYFRPFTLEDVRNAADELHSYLSSRIEDYKESRRQAVLAEDTQVESEPTVPYIRYSTDEGDIADFSSESVYPPQDDSIYSCMLDTVMGPMLYYNQGDVRWKSYLYGGSDPMSKYGCGPVCVAMVINSFTSSSVTPVEIAEWSAANGCYAAQSGSYHSLIPKSISAHGLQVESVTDRSAENAAELLASGHLLIALMGKGSLTQNGHFIIIVQSGLNDGKVFIADPASYENSTKEWDLELLMSELKKSYDSGGPLWAVSYPSEG
jgi:hypothetical protein